MPELIEVSNITFKDSFSSPPQSFLDDLKTLASTPGVIALYFGQQLENPSSYTWVARWTAQSAIDDFHASPGFASWAASYVAPLATYAITTSATYTGDAAGPLESPCTEFFSSFGAEDDFLEKRLNPFVKLIADAKPPGLRSGITGEFTPVMQVGVDEPEQKIAVLILGWNSQADHAAQKVPGTGNATCMRPLL
ncbi:dimeric alpha-beta barrel [Trichoderma arundinaceum]|uniref:Dimeric alpha-beta barrel n=1 Tax=Trichoderma arundinaceum TaxID=490622 RepID=A0A395NJL0_TRIAR|nr:dimeric alpha-beta barrel [Trichoderma arundinaceum]